MGAHSGTYGNSLVHGSLYTFTQGFVVLQLFPSISQFLWTRGTSGRLLGNLWEPTRPRILVYVHTRFSCLPTVPPVVSQFLRTGGTYVREPIGEPMGTHSSTDPCIRSHEVVRFSNSSHSNSQSSCCSQRRSARGSLSLRVKNCTKKHFGFGVTFQVHIFQC